ncbi:MAG: dockerin type I repeat-containing protein, partial [Ruminococcus sp.]|nr:dockerin type I repeat-containing protein [Ruminococcus sp.]
YAKAQNIPYILLDSVLLGDANGDGYVNISDVTDIQRAVAEMDTLDDLRKKAADVNGDGVVTIDDATILQMYLAEFATDYPIGVVTAQ